MGEGQGHAGAAGLVVLPAKVHVPTRVADVIARPVAQSRLAGALHARLTSVVAPAGFGKTTAVLSWIATLGTATPAPLIAWYTGSEEDASLERFWRHVVAALRVVDPDLLPSPDELGITDDPARMTAVLDRILFSIGERLAAPSPAAFTCEQSAPTLPGTSAPAACTPSPRALLLVLDDLHSTIGDPDVAASLQYFLRYLPAGVHVVATSRRALPIPLARMRVRGELVELTEDDLRLAPQEVDELFSHAGIALSPEDLAAVEALTHGWPTGCRLVAMMCGDGSPDDVARALTRARSTMGDYLFEEVLLDLPLDQRTFLMQTSVVDSFCPSLACAITGCSPDEVAAYIGALLEGSLFVERIEHEGDEDWYRYQPLLSELLRARGGGPGAQGVRGARLAARDWFERAGYLDAVVELSASLGDFETIRRLIRQKWRELYMSDAHGVLVRWAALLPEKELLASPFVCAVLAMPLTLHGEAGRGRALIVHAVEHLRDEEDFLFAFCMAQQAYLASFRADASSMRLYAERALAYLPADDYYLRGMMLQIQASSHIDDTPLRSRELLVAAVEQQRDFGNDNLTCSALSNLALVCANLGHLDEASYEARRALELYAPEVRERKPMLGYAWLARALVDYGRGAYEQVLADCEAFERVTGGNVAAESSAETLALRAKALLRLGRSGAGDTLERAFALDETGAAQALPDLALLAAAPAALRVRAAERLSDGGARLSLRLMGAAALALSGASVDADVCRAVDELADAIDPDERAPFVHAHIVAAALCERAAHTQAADRHLATAMRHARACDLAFLVADSAPQLIGPLRRLLAGAQDTLVVAFARELLAATGALRRVPAGATGPSVASGTPATPTVDGARAHGEPVVLTEREADVMRLIASGMSLFEAAEAMVVSRETVKKHLANIYAKLGVHSKMQAVALLRERGLI